MKKILTWWHGLNVLVQLLFVALLILAVLAIAPLKWAEPLTNLFNNREKALILWFLAFLFWGTLRKDIRRSIFGVLKALFRTEILVVLAAVIIYTGFAVVLLSKIGLWRTDLTKDTIFWLFGTAFVYPLNLNQATHDEHFFRKIVFDNLKLILVLEFIINFYTFSLGIEIILIPFLFFLGGMSAITKNRKEYSAVQKWIDRTLAAFGIILIIFASANLLRYYGDFATSDNFRAFLLPPTLTLGYLPFLYFLALFMTYEEFFVRIDIFLKRDKTLATFLKRKILVSCRANLGKLNWFSRQNFLEFKKLRDKNDVMIMIQNYKKR